MSPLRASLNPHSLASGSVSFFTASCSAASGKEAAAAAAMVVVDGAQCLLLLKRHPPPHSPQVCVRVIKRLLLYISKIRETSRADKGVLLLLL
jgi:hypothetical protein